MPNHVYLILVPPDVDALRRMLSAVRRVHADRIHARLRRTGASSKVGSTAHGWRTPVPCAAVKVANDLIRM